MPNYEDVFKADDIPKEQSTGAPNIPPPPIAEIPKEQESLTEPFHVSFKSIIIIAVCIIVLYIVVQGVPESLQVELNSLAPTKPVENNVGTIIDSVKNNEQIKEVFTEIGELNEVGEVLVWVNYTKSLRISKSHVLMYTVVCDSPQLGEFEFNLSHSQFVEIPESGILPVVSTTLTYKGDDTTYYTAFRLHDNWKNLLNGKVN